MLYVISYLVMFVATLALSVYISVRLGKDTEILIKPSEFAATIMHGAVIMAAVLAFLVCTDIVIVICTAVLAVISLIDLFIKINEMEEFDG